MPKIYLPIDLFDIHIRLYRCEKMWMVKNWQIFSQSSISPNFSGDKVSLHTVVKIIQAVLVTCMLNKSPRVQKRQDQSKAAVI